MFDSNFELNKKMFDFAIETANKKMLENEEFQLKGVVKEIAFGNDFDASKNACKLLKVCHCSVVSGFVLFVTNNMLDSKV